MFDKLKIYFSQMTFFSKYVADFDLFSQQATIELLQLSAWQSFQWIILDGNEVHFHRLSFMERCNDTLKFVSSSTKADSA